MAQAMVREGGESEDIAATVRLLPAIFRCEKPSDGRIRWTFAKGWLAEELHVAAEGANDSTLDAFFPPDLASRLQNELSRAFAGEAREFSYGMGTRTLRQYAQPVRDGTGQVVSVVGFIVEVPAASDGDAPLRSLYERMGEHMVEIATANRGVLQANRDLEAFGCMVAHDLRSPLVLLDAVLRRLAAYAPRLDMEGKDEITRGRRALDRMTQIIDDLLRFSRAGRAGLEAQPIDLSGLVAQVVEQLAHSEPGRTVEVEIQPSAMVLADERLMRIAIENLLANAWKFTRREAHARIEFGWKADANGQRVFYVRDNGAGFDPTRAHRLFHPFERLHPQSEFGGTGVGLSSVQRVLNRHGGRIWAEGAVGRGATFYFSLPEGLQRMAPSGAPPKPSS